MKTRQIRIRRPQALFLSLLIGTVVSVPGTAIATNGAQFTSISAEYFEGNTDRFGNSDGHADDLQITFTETGVGNAKTLDITVTATREVTVTCIAAGRQSLVNTSDPLEFRFSVGESPNASANFTTDQSGHLTGTVEIFTQLKYDICPKGPGNDEAAVYLVKDYSLTYTNVAVTDNENGAASEVIDRAEPGFTDPDVITFGFSTPIAGFMCTIESPEAGGCGAD